jgi:hypothetical protein
VESDHLIARLKKEEAAPRAAFFNTRRYISCGTERFSL